MTLKPSSGTLSKFSTLTCWFCSKKNLKRRMSVYELHPTRKRPTSDSFAKGAEFPRSMCTAYLKYLLLLGLAACRASGSKNSTSNNFKGQLSWSCSDTTKIWDKLKDRKICLLKYSEWIVSWYYTKEKSTHHLYINKNQMLISMFVEKKFACHLQIRC